MEQRSTKQGWFLATLTLFFGGGLLAAYFLLLFPIDKKLEAAEAELAFEVKLLEIAEANIAPAPTMSEIEVKKLLRKVPIEALVDQFLFDLGRAETISNNFISNYYFSTASYSGTGLEGEEAEQETGTNEVPETDEDTKTSNVERLTVSLSVAAPDYVNIMEFLQEIEKIERIMKVDYLSFNGFPEVLWLDQTAEDINVSITVSTFYLPKLKEFAELGPIRSYPDEANKSNPLFYRVAEENETE